MGTEMYRMPLRLVQHTPTSSAELTVACASCLGVHNVTYKGFHQR